VRKRGVKIDTHLFFRRGSARDEDVTAGFNVLSEALTGFNELIGYWWIIP